MDPRAHSGTSLFAACGPRSPTDESIFNPARRYARYHVTVAIAAVLLRVLARRDCYSCARLSRVLIGLCHAPIMKRLAVLVFVAWRTSRCRSRVLDDLAASGRCLHHRGRRLVLLSHDSSVLTFCPRFDRQHRHLGCRWSVRISKMARARNCVYVTNLLFIHAGAMLRRAIVLSVSLDSLHHARAGAIALAVDSRAEC